MATAPQSSVREGLGQSLPPSHTKHTSTSDFHPAGLRQHVPAQYVALSCGSPGRLECQPPVDFLTHSGAAVLPSSAGGRPNLACCWNAYWHPAKVACWRLGHLQIVPMWSSLLIQALACQSLPSWARKFHFWCTFKSVPHERSVATSQSVVRASLLR